MKRIFLIVLAAGLGMTAFANNEELRPMKVDGVASQVQVSRLVVADCQAVGVNKVVSSKMLGNGMSVDLVEGADGSLRKVVNHGGNLLNVESNNSNTVVSTAQRPASTLAEGDGVAFSESFEGYDGTSENWIPQGWSAQRTDKLTGTSFTWGASAPFLATPYDGNYTMHITAIMIQEDYEAMGVEKQDEWLITPSFTVAASQSLRFNAYFSPLFFFNINEGYVDFDNLEFIKKEQAYTVRVYASVDGGEWVQLYDLFDDFKDMSFMEAFMADQTWYSYKIGLEDYVGKNMRIAFQYEGMWGDNFDLDLVSVATPQPQACYQRPSGAYFLGMDEEFMSITSDYMLAAPYADLTWYNTSNDEAETFAWSYTDPETGEGTISTDVDLTANYPYTNSIVSVPVLTAYADGGSENSYAWGGDGILVGGSCLFSFSDGTSGRFGVSSANVATDMFTRLMLSDTDYAFGFGPNSKALWSSLMSYTGDENDYVDISEVGNYFPAPEVPYTLDRVYMLGAGTVDPSATINMKIYAVNEYGQIGDVIALGHISGSEVLHPLSGSQADYLSMGFDIMQIDEMGFEIAGSISIDSAIFVAISIENKGNSNFGFFQTYYPSANNETNGYFRLQGLRQTGEDEDGNPVTSEVNQLLSLENLGTDNGPCYNSFLFYLMASYDVMHCDESTTFNADNAGETKTYNVVSNYATAGWTVTKSDESADWFSYSVADGDGINSTITFDVDAMPSNITGRSCDVTITVSPSASLTFTVSQGDGSVESTVAASAAKVDVVDGDFVIAAPASIDAVSVYNIAGQLINTAAVDGTTTVDGASLAQGVYILKFNDGSSVKVVK